MRGGSKRGALVLIAGAGTAVLALAACGTPAPQTRFVASDAHDLVVQLPWDWTRINRDDVLKARPGQDPSAEEEDTQVPEGTWIAYYDGASRPAAAHVLADSVEAPIVLLQSSEVAAQSRASLTPDALRDIFRPVTAEARTQNDALMQASGLEPPKFQLDSDEEIATKTARGVHVVYRYGSGPAQEVYDQVAATDPERKRWHVLIVHCSAGCFEQHRKQIEAVADSFTIKKP